MAWDDEERVQIDRVFTMLDQASLDFEQLVDAKDRFELLDALGRLKPPDLRRILLARVLLEQQRRADRARTEPSRQAPNGH